MSLLQKAENLPIKIIQLISILFGMLLAAHIQYIQHGWINPDSVLYFESARLFAIGDWQQAVEVFKWPFYSMLLAITHKLTLLDIHTSAQLLSVLFFGITTASFLKIIQLAGGSARVMIAGSLILFSSHYLVGDVLEMLLRDQGFWAFFLSSLVFFIRFYKSSDYKDAFLWQICAIIATLFRIEGITYLIALPITLFFCQHHTIGLRICNFLKCNFLSIAATVCILGAILIFDNVSMKDFGRLNEIFTFNLYEELTRNLFEKSEIMSNQVLGKYLHEYATQAILLTFLYIVATKIILATGFVNMVLAYAATKFRARLMDDASFRILRATAIIAIINMLLIITKVFVLSGRYVLALSFVLMILASFYVADIFKHLGSPKDSKLKWVAIALLAFIFLSFCKNILPKQEGYNYRQNAVSWLKQYNPSNKPVFYDDSRVRYYAGAPFVGTWVDNWLIVKAAIKNNTINQYDFLVISQSSQHPEIEKFIAEQLPHFHLVKKFSTQDANKTLVIYMKSDVSK